MIRIVLNIVISLALLISYFFGMRAIMFLENTGLSGWASFGAFCGIMLCPLVPALLIRYLVRPLFFPNKLVENLTVWAITVGLGCLNFINFQIEKLPLIICSLIVIITYTQFVAYGKWRNESFPFNVRMSVAAVQLGCIQIFITAYVMQSNIWNSIIIGFVTLLFIKLFSVFVIRNIASSFE